MAKLREPKTASPCVTNPWLNLCGAVLNQAYLEATGKDEVKKWGALLWLSSDRAAWFLEAAGTPGEVLDPLRKHKSKKLHKLIEKNWRR